VEEKAVIQLDAISYLRLPVSERVLDKLADILFATDEILDMVRAEDRLLDPATLTVEESVQRVYDQVNDLMKQLAD
jgi:hypothetical protein